MSEGDLMNDNLRFYDKIKLKSQGSSFTVLATINDAKTGLLLALATGTQAGLRVYPDDIEDCHAESLVKRALKRYMIDKLLDSSDTEATVQQLNATELILFISQFPCGLLKRYQGSEPLDGATGAIIERKPGRGLEKDGKIVYVQRSNCLNKLKKWIFSECLQGNRFGSVTGIKCKLRGIIIGDCEHNDQDLDYQALIGELSEKLELQNYSIDCRMVRMRRDDLVFSGSKSPQAVSVVWWRHTAAGHGVGNGRLELLVDGRRSGLTRRQCESENENFKLKIADYWLRKDLARVVARLESVSKVC